MRHTPGPWKVGERAKFLSIGPEGKRHVAQTPKSNSANACLIAAAPEMLEALEWVVRFCALETYDQTDPAIAKVWTAIKKAKEQL